MSLYSLRMKNNTPELARWLKVAVKGYVMITHIMWAMCRGGKADAHLWALLRVKYTTWVLRNMPVLVWICIQMHSAKQWILLFQIVLLLITQSKINLGWNTWKRHIFFLKVQKENGVSVQYLILENTKHQRKWENISEKSSLFLKYILLSLEQTSSN